MENKQLLIQTAVEQGNQAVQTLVVDGYKVTVRYSSEKNPGAVSNIKSILLETAGIVKKCKNLQD